MVKITYNSYDNHIALKKIEEDDKKKLISFQGAPPESMWQ